MAHARILAHRPGHIGCSEELGAIFTLKDLDVDDVGMILRAPFNGVPSFVSHALIEPWGLEAVGRQNKLKAAAGDSLGLGRTKKQCSEPSAPVLLVHPDMREFAAPSPCMAVEACNDLATVAFNAASQELPIEVPRCFRIEFIDAIDQE